jgi:ubiquitin
VAEAIIEGKKARLAQGMMEEKKEEVQAEATVPPEETEAELTVKTEKTE